VKRRDIHETYEFFEYVRLDDNPVPPPDPSKIDVALLDMNHSWPNVGHDSLVHAILEAAEAHRTKLIEAGRKVRVLSFDVRRRHQIPDPPGGRFRLYVGTGGPGHLDPRLNDGVKTFSQGIREDPAWEKPLFQLFDRIAGDNSAALVAICHSFGLVCRWSGIAKPVMRPEKSTGMTTNVLTIEALEHPWFGKFASQLPDRRHFRVLDNRLFDLAPVSGAGARPLAYESSDAAALTMVELARDDSGMPRIFGANHHPELVDREHILWVLEEKRLHGEVTEQWYRERHHAMTELFHGEAERESRLTSEYALLGLLRHHIGRMA
jgi:hypothetical protein